MKQRTWYLFIAIVSIVVIPHICSSNANAQVDEAMGTNWDNAGKLYKMIVDAFEAGKQEDVYNLTGEFRDNLDYVQSKLDRVGQRLHDKDKNWPWSTKKDAAIQKTQQAKVAAGLLGSVAKSDGLVKAASDFKNFKETWASFVDMMNGLRIEYFAHAKELSDIAKAFREECPKCTP